MTEKQYRNNVLYNLYITIIHHLNVQSLWGTGTRVTEPNTILTKDLCQDPRCVIYSSMYRFSFCLIRYRTHSPLCGDNSNTICMCNWFVLEWFFWQNIVHHNQETNYWSMSMSNEAIIIYKLQNLPIVSGVGNSQWGGSSFLNGKKYRYLHCAAW